MGAMVILSALAEFIVSIKKVPAVNIIYITVPVIVNANDGNGYMLISTPLRARVSLIR